MCITKIQFIYLFTTHLSLLVAHKVFLCPYVVGEFATQTCFQGRFGEEIGSDQFGGCIMFHAPRPNENLAIGRLEYVEVICFKILLVNVLSKYRVGEVGKC